ERAVLWQGGRAVGLGMIQPSAINDHGEVVGVGPGTRGWPADALVWRSGKTTDLGPFSLDSEAIDIGDAGEVVASGSQGAFVWQKGQKLTALPTTKAGAGPPHTEAFAINNRGQIAGYGFVLVHGHTEQHLLLWTHRS